MYLELKENKVHGTKEFPYMDYHVHDTRHPFQIPVHWHDEIEILYVVRGPFIVVIEGEEYEAKTGNIFIINPGELHLMSSSNKDTDYHTFVFPLELISFQSDDDLEKNLFAPLRDGKNKFFHAISDEKDMRKMQMILEELIDVYRGNLPTKQLQIRILLLTFFERLFHNEHLFSAKYDYDKDTLRKDILTFIQQNYTDSIRLADLAAEFHLSEKYFSRYFKKSFRLTLSQYISHLRLSRAKHLLETSNLPITEVALQSGYQDVSYFIRAFHKSCGMSPLKYRNKV